MAYQNSSGRSRILSESLGSPALGTTTAVHAAVTDNGSQQVVTTGITDPVVPRNVTATAGGTAGDIKAIQVVVAGTNVYGEAITETLPAFTVDTAGTVVGSKAFATVTSITIPAHDGTGATTAIGTGAKLGLPVKLTRNTVVYAFLGGVRESTAPTVAVSSSAVESNTVSLNSALDGSAVVVDYYK
ncbi:hypothetical protein OV450_3415 [Actinobacteria bacterium OV450]|nr:hypothetical protein OV450_3415 [Actinobacteria bacterium OV450]